VPFDADTTYALMLQHLQGTIRPPHELKPELHIPEALSQVILKAMEKSREQRFQTAEDLIEALDQVTNATAAKVAVGDRTPELPTQASATSATATELPPAPTAAKPVPTTAAANGVLAHPASEPPAQAVLASVAATDSLPTRETAASSEPASAPIAPSSVQSSVQSNPSAGSQVLNSAVQQVLLPPRSLNTKLFLRLVVVGLAAVLVAGAGYLKYRSVRRVNIERAVAEKLQAAPSQTLRQAGVRVFVSEQREVTLDGKVRAVEDSVLAASLAGSVSGVAHVNNRLVVESSDWLINRGLTFLDAGDYPSAIDCFRKALADPNNKGALELLERAKRAQLTEEELLKNRQ